jgi:alpha-tubulin suppressor-like RCC1 family protein
MAGILKMRAPSVALYGRLFVFGSNSNGQLGIGVVGAGTSKSSPVQLGSLADWMSMTGGADFSHGLRSGMLWALGGDNSPNGGLGDGTLANKSSPIQIGSEVDWSMVRSGRYVGEHAGGLRAGKLFMWGFNNNYQLGLGDLTIRSSPVQVGADTDWTYVSPGRYETLALRGGKLFAWGYNNVGQLGLGDIAKRSSPVQVGAATDWSVIDTSGGAVHGIRGGMLFGWGEASSGVLGDGTVADKSSPVQIGSETDWTSVSQGRITVVRFKLVRRLTGQ